MLNSPAKRWPTTGNSISSFFSFSYSEKSKNTIAYFLNILYLTYRIIILTYKIISISGVNWVTKYSFFTL